MSRSGLAGSALYIAIEKECDAQSNELEQARRGTETTSKLAEPKLLNELYKIAAAKDPRIQGFKSKIESMEVEKNSITEVVKSVEKSSMKVELKNYASMMYY